MCSKDYSWEWLTTDKKLSDGPAELVHVHQIVTAASTGCNLYNGRSASGKLAINLSCNTFNNPHFDPSVPLYMGNGIYFTIGTNTAGVMVQWRDLPTYKAPPVPPTGP